MGGRAKEHVGCRQNRHRAPKAISKMEAHGWQQAMIDRMAASTADPVSEAVQRFSRFLENRTGFRLYSSAAPFFDFPSRDQDCVQAVVRNFSLPPEVIR